MPGISRAQQNEGGEEHDGDQSPRQAPDLSIVLACYQDGPHLLINVACLIRYLQETTLAVEIIFVDDGSYDNTSSEMVKAAELVRSSGYQAETYRHACNRGRGAAVTTGLLASRGEVVGFMDIDLENGLDGLLPMFLQIKSNYCSVIVAERCHPFGRNSLIRMIASYAYRSLRSILLPLPVKDSEAGFKFFRRRDIYPLLLVAKDQGWFWDTEILWLAHQAGLQVEAHPVVFTKDLSKKSTVYLISDGIRSLAGLARLASGRRSTQLRPATNLNFGIGN